MIRTFGMQIDLSLFNGLAIIALVAMRADAQQTPIDFARDIRPILSDACFQCHGPDEGKREADLRLDRKQDAFADLGNRSPFVAGDVNRSEALRRITSDDPDERMPPPDSG